MSKRALAVAADVLMSLGFSGLRRNIFCRKNAALDIVVEIRGSRTYFCSFLGGTGCGDATATRKTNEIYDSYFKATDPSRYSKIDRPYIYGASFFNFDREGRFARHGSFQENEGDAFRRLLTEIVLPKLGEIDSLSALYDATVEPEVVPPFGWTYSNPDHRYIHACVLGKMLGTDPELTRSKLAAAMAANAIGAPKTLDEFVARAGY